MSINHYYSPDLQQPPQWWSHYMMDSSAKTSSSPNLLHNSSICISPQQFYQTNGAMFCNRNNSAAVSFDLNNEDEDDEHQAADDGENNSNTAMESEKEEVEIPKERLFEKPLTPSDVGKLNRLVIPKQHAEKHFPLNGGAESGENGLLLGFEDEVGKSWRFRYSYWNSSQSYVLTKGWSRFVKEKRLDAGDIVVFSRHRVDTGRFFIGWRRRNSVGQDGGVSQPPQAASNGGAGWNRVYYPGHPYPSHQGPSSSSLPYQPDQCLHAGSSPVVQNQTTTTGSGNSKRLRLFGVNMECQLADESEPSTPVGSPMSSQGQAHHHHHQPGYHQYYSSNHMELTRLQVGYIPGDGYSRISVSQDQQMYIGKDKILRM
ncbi:hypothetical protein DH2020_026395 [Rehmannia glutinosa]|uniref:TF-B3 domain-containing protein n=1 Tax=Rehmannia glutinosa TaxID=99300 RepID=A0ABR0VX38_REHGL